MIVKKNTTARNFANGTSVVEISVLEVVGDLTRVADTYSMTFDIVLPDNDDAVNSMIAMKLTSAGLVGEGESLGFQS